MKMKEHDGNALAQIHNLADYIKLLEEYPSAYNIFRGENAKFGRRLASAFRSGKVVSFKYMISEYFSTVGHRLSDIEKGNFLAFAQHYGLPTNLIDVTSNPLSALFFACHESIDKGYVYIYPNDIFMDITEVVESYPSASVFDLYVNGNKLTLEIIHDLIHSSFENTRGLMYFNGNAFVAEGISYANHLFCKSFFMARDMYLERNKGKHSGEFIKKHIDNITPEQMLANISGNGAIIASEFMQGYYKIVNVERKRFDNLRIAILKDDVMKDIKESPILADDLYYLIYFTLYCLRTEQKAGGERDYTKYGDLFPPMVYRPKITFERARQQGGYFIYMPYIQRQGMFTGHEIDMGNIAHIQTVEVCNTAKILDELDNVGVNLGTIYGDFDSIAKYIKAKAEKQDRNGE